MAGNRCDFCGKDELLPFNCRYCGGTFCSSHRLPENHMCIGLKTFKERSTVKPVQRTGARKPGGIIDRISRPKKIPLSGKYAYILLAITVAAFILQIVFDNFLHYSFTNMFALNAKTVLTHPWAIVTNIFMHGSAFHLFFNMIVLFFFGPILERTIGTKNFLLTYFGAGIFAGLMQVFLFPQSAVIGASGALFGVLGALAVIMPNLRIYLYFIPMKLVWAVLLFAILDLVFMGVGDNIAHAAHLTGLLVGVLIGYWYRKKMSIQTVYWRT